MLALSSGAKPADSGIPDLINQLSADDAAARSAAANQLIAMGPAARPAVIAAEHGDDPETASQAAEVILRMPWAQNGDPQDVRDILQTYGTDPGGVDARKKAVDSLAALPGGEGLDALIRLVYEDPSDVVRWDIVHQLRTSDAGPRLARLRTVKPPADDAPMTALCGYALMAADSPKTKPMLMQAAQQSLKQNDDNGELDFLISNLCDLDEDDGHFDDAAKLLRQELTHSPPTDREGVPLPLTRLFAIQADHGPLAGYDDDLKLAADFMDTSKISYAMARIDQTQGKKAEAAKARTAAFDANSDSRLGRYQTGRFLTDRGWTDEAEAELKTYLSMPPGDDQGDLEASETNAHFALSALAANRQDWLEAAEQKKFAVAGTDATEFTRSNGVGRNDTITSNDIWAEVDWLYLKAALASKETTATDQHLQEIIGLAPKDEDIAIDVVPLLKERKRTADAKHLYDAARLAAQDRLDADPTNPSLMNGLAWLEAKCDENLDDALKQATAAVNAVPDNAAAIDTLAEVNFHLGKAAAAVELEERALKLQPDDPFMTGQLARFKAAVH